MSSLRKLSLILPGRWKTSSSLLLPSHLSSAIIPENNFHVLSAVSPTPSSPYFGLFHILNTHLILLAHCLKLFLSSCMGICKALHSWLHPSILFMYQSLHTLNHHVVNCLHVCLLQGKDQVLLTSAI